MSRTPRVTCTLLITRLILNSAVTSTNPNPETTETSHTVYRYLGIASVPNGHRTTRSQPRFTMDPDQLTSRGYGRYAEPSKYERGKIPGYDTFGHATIMSSTKGGQIARARYDELSEPPIPRPSSLFPSAGPTGKRGSRACVSCKLPWSLCL